MEEIVKQITDKWKEMIESTIVSGYSRKVESVNCFRMDKYYTGYPEIEFCYKVVFNFEDGISNGQTHSNANRYEWHKKLEETFTKIFWDPHFMSLLIASDEVMPVPGSNSGEIKFENSKVDYMTNQGYRFIVQFYPQGFLSEFREEKLNELGI